MIGPKLHSHHGVPNETVVSPRDLPHPCLHSAEADVRPQKGKSEFDPKRTHFTKVLATRLDLKM